MKTTLVILIAGLIFLIIPLQASAAGKGHEQRGSHYQNRINDNEHYKYDRNQRYNYKVEKRHHRQQRHNQHRYAAHHNKRQNLRHANHQHRHSYKRSHYIQVPLPPHPAVLIGLPQLLFNIKL